MESHLNYWCLKRRRIPKLEFITFSESSTCRVPFALTTVEASSTGELRSRLLAFKHQSVQSSPAHQGDIYEYLPLRLLTRCFIQRLFTTFSSGDIICHHLELLFSWSFLVPVLPIMFYRRRLTIHLMHRLLIRRSW